MVEPLTFFGLRPRESYEVWTRLSHEGLWIDGPMVYDWDADLLATTTQEAKVTVMRILAEMGLLPQREVTFIPVK